MTEVGDCYSSLSGTGHLYSNWLFQYIRPEDTYRRKVKLGSKTTGQRLNRAPHAFHRLHQASTFGGLSNIGSTKTLLLSASVKTLKLTRLHAEIASSWPGPSTPRPRGHSQKQGYYYLLNYYCFCSVDKNHHLHRRWINPFPQLLASHLSRLNSDVN